MKLKRVFSALALAAALALTACGGNSNRYSDPVTGEYDYQTEYVELCDFLEENSPVLNEYNELYGLTYEEVKDCYSESIADVRNDFEYYACLTAFLNNIPSMHLQVGFPGAGYADAEMTEGLSENGTFCDAQQYWQDVLHEECRAHYEDDPALTVFSWFSGEYRCVRGGGIPERATLLTVDGVPADEFILLMPSAYKLKHDHAAGKNFRDGIMFNDKFGTPCTVEYRDTDGTVRTEELYCGAESELVLGYTDYFKALDGMETENDKRGQRELVVLPDEENGIVTIIINTFDSDTVTGEVIANTILSSAEEFDHIIIDIRNNNGGYINYAYQVLSALTTEDILVENEVYTPVRRDGFEPADNGLFRRVESRTVEGKLSEKKNFYLLVSDYTASSADTLAYEFKKNGLGTVLGTNACAGERDGVIRLGYLRGSGIYYYYVDRQSFDPDGKGSSAYGTAPDVYLTADVEYWFDKQRLYSPDEDIEGRLEWDGVLRQVYFFIKA